MANVTKKENLTIAIREYEVQGQTKKVWKTVGELITWDDGRQSFEMWGPTGATRGVVFSQDDNSSRGAQQAQQQQVGFQQPQGQGFQQPQGGYNQGGFDQDPPF